MAQEVEEIKARYERRKNLNKDHLYPAFSPFQHFSRAEREFWYGDILQRHFEDLESLKELTVLEAGAGSGDNLFFLRRLGFQIPNIFAADLLPERCESLKSILPQTNIFCGDASVLPLPKVDVIFQATMFSSILDKNFQLQLAKSLWAKLNEGGIFIWYDFVVDNPLNRDVRGISRRQIRQLFPEAKRIESHGCTLAPPIGRRVGRFYNLANLPFLRTHVVAAIYK